MNRKLLAILLTLSAVALTACGTDPGTNNTEGGGTAHCGNNKVEGNEACDGSALAGKTCSSVDPNFTGGTLKCSNTCQFDTSGCKKTENPPPANCGNGTLDAGEQCDGSVPAGKTCSTETSGAKPNGNLKCTACKIDTTECKEDTPQPTVMKCSEAQNWFGQKGKSGPLVDGEYGAYTNESGIKAAIAAIRAFPEGQDEHDVDLAISKAVVVAEDFEGANAYVQDKDGALFLRKVGEPKGTFKPGQVVSFKITKVTNYFGKPQVSGISDLNIEKSETSKVKAINLNTTEVTKANDVFKFVTFQGKISKEKDCSSTTSSTKYNCYEFTAFDNASKKYQFRQRTDVTWIKNGDCIVFAGPLDYYNDNVQLQTSNYDWGKKLEE